MNTLVEKLMRMINQCAVDNSPLSVSRCVQLVQESKIDLKHKAFFYSLFNNCHSLTDLNRKIYDYNYDLEQKIKHEKRMQKFQHQTDSDDVLYKDFEQFQDYVYSLVSLNNYKSRVSKSKAKVQLFNIDMLYGHDSEEAFKDVVQEGRLYLWEGLKKYGFLPEKSKNFKDRKGERTKSSKSTFVFQNLKNSYINLGAKSSGKKFKHIMVDDEFLKDKGGM